MLQQRGVVPVLPAWPSGLHKMHCVVCIGGVPSLYLPPPSNYTFLIGMYCLPRAHA